ncbi:MAG: L-seryl-tRNA(Sec) selenium transferase [Actinobacteria bacterium]|nr:L-seryl-tRNA(Sec) selenium transferase [Actinomycetota bacterium]
MITARGTGQGGAGLPDGLRGVVGPGGPGADGQGLGGRRVGRSGPRRDGGLIGRDGGIGRDAGLRNRLHGPDPGRHGQDPAPRRRRDEHDHDAERGEEADLLHEPHVHGGGGRRAAQRCVVVPQRAEHGPQREPGPGRRGQQRAEQRGVPAPGDHEQEAAEEHRGARQDLQPQPRRVVGPRLVWRVSVVEVRSDEGNECAPQSEQHQQESAERSPAAPHTQHPGHGYHFPSESRCQCGLAGQPLPGAGRGIPAPRGIVRDVDALRSGGDAPPDPGNRAPAADGPPDRRRVPRTDLLLADPRLAAAERTLGRPLVKAAVRRAQQRARDGRIAPEQVADAAVAELPPRAAALTPVINATGVLVHTNLGRAPLSAAAAEAIAAAAGHCDLEFDLTSGVRARRGAGALDALARAVPAAEAVAVVNNNAAALVLAATALTSAEANEIVVSRGELIEIGDRFRLPDLLACTGARLREVGTTNRTTAADYAEATGPQTAFVLKVHPSNFRLEGFTAAAAVPELTGLGVPVIFDIGSGLLAPHPLLPDEPSAATALRDGADMVTASGDKLLGGPQAGLVLGRAALVRRLTRHPLARALRVDKLTLAALEATLAGPVPPVAGALAADPASLFHRAERAVLRLVSAGLDAQVADAAAAVGGGGAPGVELPSAAISLPESLAAPLRWDDAVARGERPAVVGRLEGGRLLLDLRAVPPESDAALVDAILAVQQGDSPCR